MTETNPTPEAITVTDAQVDEFFNNDGVIPTTPPAEEKVEAVVEEPKEEEKKEKVVNYGALHEERMRRKEASERAKKAEERAAELERKLAEYAQPKQEVNYDEDPVEALKRKQDEIEKVLIAQANQAIKQNENSKYWNRIRESELAFKQDKPDFDDAIKFLADTRIDELKDIGWSEEEAQKVLSDEIRWIADKAYADEVNPAERFYNLAKRRGFSSNKEPIANNADMKLEIIKKGMEKNKSLPPASKSIKQDLTLEALADMKVDALSNLRGDTEFDRAWNKLFGS